MALPSKYTPSSQQVYPPGVYLLGRAMLWCKSLRAFRPFPRLVLPLPYASTGSTVCMHGERSSNGCCPSYDSLAKWSNLFSQDRKGRQFELFSPRIPTGAGWKIRSNSAHRETPQGPVEA